MNATCATWSGRAPVRRRWCSVLAVAAAALFHGAEASGGPLDAAYAEAKKEYEPQRIEPAAEILQPPKDDLRDGPGALDLVTDPFDFDYIRRPPQGEPAAAMAARLPGKILDLQFTRDGRAMAACSSEGAVGVWTVVDGRRIALLQRKDKAPVHAVEFTSDDSSLAIAGGGEVWLWRVRPEGEAASATPDAATPDAAKPDAAKPNPVKKPAEGAPDEEKAVKEKPADAPAEEEPTPRKPLVGWKFRGFDPRRARPLDRAGKQILIVGWKGEAAISLRFSAETAAALAAPFDVPPKGSAAETQGSPAPEDPKAVEVRTVPGGDVFITVSGLAYLLRGKAYKPTRLNFPGLDGPLLGWVFFDGEKRVVGLTKEKFGVYSYSDFPLGDPPAWRLVHQYDLPVAPAPRVRALQVVFDQMQWPSIVAYDGGSRIVGWDRTHGRKTYDFGDRKKPAATAVRVQALARWAAWGGADGKIEVLRLPPIPYTPRMKRAAYGIAVARALGQKQFDALEEEAGRLRKNPRERTAAGRLGEVFWESLVAPPVKDVRAQTQALLEEYAKKHPKSVVPRTALVDYYQRKGAEARGSASAAGTSAAQFRAMAELHAKGKAYYDEVRDLGVEDPHLWSAAMALARYGAMPKEEFEPIVEGALKLDPGYPPFARQLAVVLLPRWGGAPGAGAEFAEALSRRIPSEDDAAELYAVVADETILWEKFPRIEDGGFDAARLVKCLKRLETLEPEQIRWPTRRALVELQRGEAEAALDAWSRVRDLSPLPDRSGVGEAVKAIAALPHRGAWKFRSLEPSLRSVAFAPEGGRVATVGGARLRVQDVFTGRKVLDVPCEPLSFAGISPDGRRAAVYSFDEQDHKILRVLDVDSNEEIFGTSMLESGPILAFSNTGVRLLHADPVRVRARVYDMTRGMKWFAVSSPRPESTVFTEEGKRILAHSASGFVESSAVDGAPLRLYEFEPKGVVLDALAVDPKGGGVLAAGADALWAIDRASGVCRAVCPLARTRRLIVSLDGRWVAAEGEAGLQLVDLKAGKRLGVIPFAGSLQAVAFSANGARMWTALDGFYLDWDLERLRTMLAAAPPADLPRAGEPFRLIVTTPKPKDPPAKPAAKPKSKPKVEVKENPGEAENAKAESK